jgi:hypothetical protein
MIKRLRPCSDWISTPELHLAPRVVPIASPLYWGGGGMTKTKWCFIIIPPAADVTHCDIHGLLRTAGARLLTFAAAARAQRAVLDTLAALRAWATEPCAACSDGYV